MGADWPRVPLRGLIEFSRDGEWGTAQPQDDCVEMLVVRGADFARLRTGALAEIPRRYIRRVAAERKELQAGDVLIETAGGTKDESTGRTVLVKASHIERAGIPLICASFARFIRFDRKSVDSGFMYWWLQSLHASGEMETHQVQHTGVARFHFTKFVERTLAPFPDPSEQSAIAHILGTLDDKVELNRRLSETLEEIATALFMSWFAGLDVPSVRAEEIELAGILEIGDGYRAKNTELGKPGMPFIRAGDLNGGFDTHGAEYLQETSVAKAGSKVAQVGDVAFTSKGTIGRFARVGEHSVPFVYSPQVCFWRSLQPARLHPAVLYCWMQSDAFIEQVMAVAGQTDMAPYVSLRDQRRMLIPRFPVSQSLIGDRIQAVLRRQSLAASESRVLAALRDTLLPKLISGELRVKDAERVVAGAGH